MRLPDSVATANSSCPAFVDDGSSGYRRLEGVMLRAVAKNGGEIGVCGSCMDARGIADGELEEGCARSSMEELTAWTLGADRTLVV